MSQPLIDLQHISKRFDDTLVLDDLSLSVKENSFVTLLGPSGCGKTTTLRIIGGFESPNTGKVIFGGEDITKLPPNKRQLNTVFQKYALFPHMSIADNIAFGLKIKNKSKHKHQYADVLISVGPSNSLYTGEICTICGKIKNLRLATGKIEINGKIGCRMLTNEETKEKYKELKEYHIDNLFQKYVKLEENDGTVD